MMKGIIDIILYILTGIFIIFIIFIILKFNNKKNIVTIRGSFILHEFYMNST